LTRKKSLTVRLSPTVNSVAPHAIETEMSAQWSEEKRRSIVDAILLKRLGTPDDVAEAVLFSLDLCQQASGNTAPGWQEVKRSDYFR